MKFTDEELQQAREVNLPAFLNISEKELRLIQSPFREDKHPSFSVFRGENGNWIGHDMATCKSFDAISIVMALFHIDFVLAVRSMLSFPFSQALVVQQHKRLVIQPIARHGLSGDRPAEATTGSPEKAIKGQIACLWHEDNERALEYLQDTRGISQDVISAVYDRVKIVDIKNDKFSVCCLAFENLAGGYNCRAINGWRFTHVAGRQGLTVFDFAGARGKDDVWVFESNIDALSFSSMFFQNGGQLISLNSVANLSLMAGVNLRDKHVFCCLDKDAAGNATTKKALASLKDKCLSVIDARHFIESGKDINEALLFFKKYEELEKKENMEVEK